MSENKTDEPKLDLILSLVQTQSELIKRLERQLELKNSWIESKWITTGELAEITKNKTGTVTNWIYKGKIPSSIIKKITKGKSHKYLVNSKEGVKAIRCIKEGTEYEAGGE